MATSPFDYVNAINSKKDYIRNNEDPEKAEKDYPAFMVNKALSLFSDTIMLANIMNLFPELPGIMQQDFLLNTVRPRKRMTKWPKTVVGDDLKVISLHYKCNLEVAAQYRKLLTDEDIGEIEQLYYKGE